MRCLIQIALGDRLCLGGDIVCRSYWRAYGGVPGFDDLLTIFTTRLQEVPESEFQAIRHADPVHRLPELPHERFDVAEERQGLQDLRVAPRRSLAAEIASALRERILIGDLRPGARIGELEVAQAFGTSQAPVREAFATLRSQGLLVTLPRRGTFVSSVFLIDARMAYEIRRRVESYIFEQALANLTDADLEALEQLVREMRFAAARGDLETMTRHDMDLHGYLYGRVGSEMLQRIWDLLSANIRTFVVAAGPELMAPEEFKAVPEMHARLVRLMRAKDADGLREELNKQLDLIWQRLDEAETKTEANKPA